MQSDGDLVGELPQPGVHWSMVVNASFSLAVACTSLAAQTRLLTNLLLLLLCRLLLCASSAAAFDAQNSRVWSTNTAGLGSGPGYKLVVLDTGNVVLYDAAGRALWATNTSGHRKT